MKWSLIDDDDSDEVSTQRKPNVMIVMMIW